MIRDVCIAAAHMLGLTEDAEALAGDDCPEELAAEYLRLYGLVVSEIAEEYRRGEDAGLASSPSLTDGEAELTGISRRMLAYGVAAEYAITRGMDVAEMWEERFKSALALAKRPPVRIPQRRFV